MFRKLVSNMPFSPGLVGQVGFYIKRLKQEEFIRRVGMIFTALSIAVQTLSVFMPPTHATAGSTNNMIFEAVTSKSSLLKVWDNGDTNGNKDIDDIFRFYNIARSDIEKATQTTMNSDDEFNGYEIWTMGRKAYGKPGEYKQVIPTNEGANTTVYVRPWARSWGVYKTEVIKGTTVGGQQFAVIMNCGNLVVAIKDLPTPQPYQSYFRTNCEDVGGWVYDPRRLTATIRIRITVDDKEVAKLDANQENYSGAQYYKDGIPGDHGFFWTIPESYKDGKDHKVVVTILESATDVAARGGITGASEGSMIIRGQPDIIGAECYTPPPSPPTPQELEVCDITTGEIIKISEDDKDNPNYVDASECDLVDVCRPDVGILRDIHKYEVLDGDFSDLTMCGEIEICVDNQIIAIPRYSYDGQPTSCPEIQVCRDDVVITITTDKREDGDLEPEACDQLQICDPDTNAIITVLRKDYDEDVYFFPYIDSYGNLTCDEPTPEITENKQASNITQEIDNADGTQASPGDVIVYELTTANIGTLDGTFDIHEDLEDVLEYADLTDNGGGSYDPDSHVLSWTGVDIAAGHSLTHTFEITVKSVLPETAVNQANRASFDFNMNNVYGDTVNITLPKPLPKEVEEFADTLPNTGPAENSFFIGLFILLVFFFYFRNRLVTKELTMIKKEFNGI